MGYHTFLIYPIAFIMLLILIGVGCMGNLYFDLGCFLRFQIAYIDIIWPKKGI